MKRSLLSGLGLCLFTSITSLGAFGCAEETGEDIALPGDIDDAPAGGDGKGDAWDTENNPANLANRLNYEIAALPRTGKLDKPVWASRYPQLPGDVVMWSDTYWPTAQGSTNDRWLGQATKSPLEKYDTAFNNAAGCEQPTSNCGTGAKASWDQYLSCAGPAAKWHAGNFQGSRQMYDGVDSDADGTVDECGSDKDGIANWWGLCHAWAPAALLEPEPQHAVTYNGVKFEVADIKALLDTVYDTSEALMLGGRCNAEKFTPGPNGPLDLEPDCMDVNPGALHVILGNFLGLKDQALVMDKTASSEVWNQPIYSYDVTKQAKVTGKVANTCIGVTGDTYTRNSAAVDLYEVEVDVEYLTEGSASVSPLGMSGYLTTDQYHYILEVDRRGKIVGGTYCTDSINDHPDFLWAPTGPTVSSYGRNPNVAMTKVRTLLELSRKAETGGGTTEGRSYAASGTSAIPDNAPAGTKLDIVVPDTFTAKGLSVEVDIAHTWRGDLKVTLKRNGTVVKVLHDRTGGSAQNLKETFTLTATELGSADPKATWSLAVVDTAAQDTGTVNGFKLTFAE